VLAHRLTFSAECDKSFFQQLPASAAVFVLRGDGEPYVSKTANLRRRLERLLGPPAALSKRLNLRERVRDIEFTLAGSEFESQILLYRVLRATFPKTYAARLKLRPAPLVKLHLENEYPRASVTTKLGKFVKRDGTAFSRADNASNRMQRHEWNSCPPHPDGANSCGAEAPSQSALNGTAEAVPFRGDVAREAPQNLFYGPFPSRIAAEKFASDALDFFNMRRCVEDLHPDPSFPGCVYSEMKMCLAPCFKGCTDSEYHTEVARVQNFFDTQGDSLSREFSEQRDRASADLAFEEAAAAHAKLEKLKPLLSQLPEIVRRIDQLRALIIQPAAGTESSAQSVSLFLFEECTMHGPVEFSIAPIAESRSMESRLEEWFAKFPPSEAHRSAERTEHLAMLKRWYYRSTRVGEIFFADQSGQWPMRRIVRGIGRVAKGEKPETPATFSASPASTSPS
jgi:excinuclease UvrABC nuclease subunit